MTLRERIANGELEAFLDPALELELLAEPDAAWWWEGASVVARRLFNQMSLRYGKTQWEAHGRMSREWTRSLILRVARDVARTHLSTPDTDAVLPVLARWCGVKLPRIGTTVHP